MADKNPAKKTTAGSTPGQVPPVKEENEVQRRMREVLEAKLAKQKRAQGEDHLGGHSVGPATNDKHQRQFRRKSGSS